NPPLFLPILVGPGLSRPLLCYRAKGKTLTTAQTRKAQPSPAPMGDMSAEVLTAVLRSLDESKAEELVSIDIRRKTSLADHMVIASGRSHRHVSSIADHLIKALKDSGHTDIRVEGLPGADWVLIDLGDVIVHVFRPEVREFYNLEKMWQTPDMDEQTVH